MTQHGKDHHHGHDHNHEHHQHDNKKWHWHRDWRLWVGVILMLAAMFVYVMSDDLGLGLGGAAPQGQMPAAP